MIEKFARELANSSYTPNFENSPSFPDQQHQQHHIGTLPPCPVALLSFLNESYCHELNPSGLEINAILFALASAKPDPAMLPIYHSHLLTSSPPIIFESSHRIIANVNINLIGATKARQGPREGPSSGRGSDPSSLSEKSNLTQCGG